MKVALFTVLLFSVVTSSVLGQTRTIENCANGEPTTGGGFPDDDQDGVPNSIDNCSETANDTQIDTDSDGIGNACDADLNNDGMINVVDLGLMKSVFFSTDPGTNADLNGDGSVTPDDLAILRASFHGAPGPVGPCRADPESCKGPVRFEFDDVGEVANGNLFIFQTNDPATIYHARRLLSGQSLCNPSISGNTLRGSQPYNPDWGFHMDDNIGFHGTNIEPLEDCDRTADFVETNIDVWCGDDDESVCRFWCPWRSKLTREMP